MKQAERILTCIICPRGCELRVTPAEDGAAPAVTGNACPRGKAYAEAEIICPIRTLTTTVRTRDGRVVPVKSAKPIPKDLLFDAMREVNALRAPDHGDIGDVLLADLAGTGIPLVLTAEYERPDFLLPKGTKTRA